MTYSENISNILKYLRVANELTQSDLANIIGTSRQKVHRIETQQIEMKTEEWLCLEDHFGINTNAIKIGLLNLTPNKNEKEIFSLLEKFKRDAFSGGRVINIYKWNFERLYGRASFDSFCREEKVDPLYFTNINNSLSMDFNLRLIEQSIRKGWLKEKDDLDHFCQLVHKQKFHQADFQDELWSFSGVDRIKCSIEKRLGKYEQNHTYKVEEYSENAKNKYILFSSAPKEHINFDLYNNIFLKGFFEKILERYFVNMMDRPCSIKKISSFYDKSKRGRFLVKELS